MALPSSDSPNQQDKLESGELSIEKLDQVVGGASAPSPSPHIDQAMSLIGQQEHEMAASVSAQAPLSTTALLAIQQQIAAETLAVSVVTNTLKEESDATKNITANFR